MLVIFDIKSGISIQGLTSELKVSMTSYVFSSNLIIATSIILSLYLSKPVVSKSKQIIIISK